MNTQLLSLQHSKLLILALALPIAWASPIAKNSLILVQTPLSIQTSKMDPPRIAFDEINSPITLGNKISTSKNFPETAMNLNDGPKIKTRGSAQSLFNRRVVLNSMVFTKNEVSQEIDRINSMEKWVETLTPAERRRVEAANEKFGVIDTNIRNPSFKELAQQKLDELAKLEPQASNSGSKVYVQGADELHKAGVEVKKTTGFEVSGQIELSGLPPPSSQWQVRIARYDDDVKKEDAHVDTGRAYYKIRVPELTGSINAELVDTKTGNVIGEGSYRLSQYVADKISGHAKIVIAGNSRGYAVNATDFDHNRRQGSGIDMMMTFGGEGATKEDGSYKFDQVLNGSRALVRTQAKGFYPEINLVRAGTEKNIPLFRAKMISALKEIVAEQAVSSEVPENGSIVWGQVTQDGVPLSGAELDIEFLDNYQPVYFNALLLPDPTLKSTGTNGYFAFINLPAGFHAIVASRGEAYLSHSNVVVDDQTLSVADVEVKSLKEKVRLKIFDAFNGNPEKAAVEMQSLGQNLDVNGFAEIELANLSRLSFMRVHPMDQKYLDSVQMYEDDMESIQAPLIDAAWLQGMMGRKRITADPDSGTIIAFVNSSHFEAYLGHDPTFLRSNVIYFDAQGEPSETAVSGGGVILFNVPTGVQSVVLAENGSELLQTQVVPVDPSSLTVLKFR